MAVQDFFRHNIRTEEMMLKKHKDAIMGVSAGCVHGASFLSGQKGRSVRYTTKFCDNPNYMGFRSLITTGTFFNKDFC